MIASLLVAASVAVSTPAPVPESLTVSQAEHAIQVGRLDQARLMIANLIGKGAKGAAVERLLADLDFASGKNREALIRYRQLLAASPNDSAMNEKAGVAALRIGETGAAGLLLERATGSADASWRAWNARGVLADFDRDWQVADTAYDHAERLAPGEAEVLNNRGWSHLLRGDWSGAAGLFEAAVAHNPTERMRNNLELAQAALAGKLPGRRAGEGDRAWAERLNDAGVAAELLGDKQRAIVAFTEALEASGSWYARAANNLEAAGGRP